MREKQLRRIYDQYAGPRFGYVLSLLADEHEARDVLQTVFLRVVRHEKRVLGARKLRNYLFAMARNETKRVIRMRIKNRELGEKACMVLLESRDERTTLEDRERVAMALSQLPPEQREVIVLKIWEGFTFKEISRILDIPQDTCASRYRYGLQKLKDGLDL